MLHFYCYVRHLAPVSDITMSHMLFKCIMMLLLLVEAHNCISKVTIVSPTSGLMHSNLSNFIATDYYVLLFVLLSSVVKLL